MAKDIHVILHRDVAKLGKGGDVVKVSAGYARNYLVPQGIAVSASAGNVSHFEHQTRGAAERSARALVGATADAAKLSALEITVARATGSEGKLYGSVTTKDIESELRTRGFDIDRKSLHADSIRALGTYTVTVRIAPEVQATFKVHVVAAPRAS